MPIYDVPPDARKFVVVRGKGGDFAVSEDHAPPRLFIPCRDEAQARDVADRLNAGERRVRVDLLG